MNLPEALKAMARTHTAELGVTSYIVDLGNGKYMPANPKDFTIHSTTSAHAFLLLAQCRTVVYAVRGSFFREKVA